MNQACQTMRTRSYKTRKDKYYFHRWAEVALVVPAEVALVVPAVPSCVNRTGRSSLAPLTYQLFSVRTIMLC